LPRWLRWLGYGLGAVVGLLVLAVAGLYLVTSSALSRTYRFPDSSVRAATDSTAVERGRHLVDAIGKCQVCHGEDFGGQVMMDSPVFARLYASNLTAGEGGIGNYTDADLERAIRHGVDPDGRPLVFMPAEAYAALSDVDLAAVMGYLRTVPAVNRQVPAPRVGPIARALYLRGNFPLLPVELVNHTERPSAPAPAVTVDYGEYLATIGGCRSCHGSGLAGTGDPSAPDISKARLGSWTEEDFFRALRQGRRPDGSVIDPSKMPWVRSGRMTDDEMKATWLYVSSREGKAES
jgi:mono/diheme cytochrome c family protein